MDLSNFLKSEQKKAIHFWYETNAKVKNMEKTFLGMSLEVNVTYKIEIQ